MVNRVAVTGFGAVCALGNSVPELTESLRTGRSGVRLIAADPVSSPVAGGFPLLEGEEVNLSVSDRALFDPVTRYAMHAAREALEQCGLLDDHSLRQRTAVYLGTAGGGAHSMEEAHRDVWYHGTRPKPLAVLSAMANAPASHLSIRFGLTGPNLTYSIACASSAVAIGEAFRAVRDGRIDCALVGGAEACMTPVVVRAWQSMRILASVDARVPPKHANPSRGTARGWCWEKALQCSCWRGFTVPWHAAHRYFARSSASAARPTHPISACRRARGSRQRCSPH